MSLDQAASKFKRKRASVATDDDVKPRVVKTKKHASSSSGLKHQNRQLEKMDEIPHTGNKNVIKKNQVKFARKFIFIATEDQTVPLFAEDDDEVGIEAALAANAVNFWYTAVTQGDAMIMAVTLMPKTFDRQDKSAGSGRSLWWAPIIAASTRRLLLGTKVSMK